MLGDTYEHLGIDSRFLEWVSEQVLERSAIVIEWLDSKPFPQNSRYAPVGDYMFSPLVSTYLRPWRRQTQFKSTRVTCLIQTHQRADVRCIPKRALIE